MNPSIKRARLQLGPRFRTVSTADLAAVRPDRCLQVLPAGDVPGAESSLFPRTVRVVNVLVALVALLVGSPLMLLIALAIKLTSPGPVFYTQPRVGLDRRRGSDPRWDCVRKVDHGGRIFTIYKFRTMRAEQPGVESQVWARRDDARVTLIGRVLRRYRLDEFPQLINVLRGDMNIVGPRPEQPQIFRELREQIAGYAHRQRVLPGITGWAQVHQGYDSSLDSVRAKLRYDLEYLENVSPVNDIRIMLRTIPVMLFQRGGW
jgi:lipopolysaccharide/colanic/teichoic acid biosynthesis glycosyltransferase